MKLIGITLAVVYLSEIKLEIADFPLYVGPTTKIFTVFTEEEAIIFIYLYNFLVKKLN